MTITKPADQADEQPADGWCARCSRWAKNGVVHWVARSSASDVRLVLHANRADCREAR